MSYTNEIENYIYKSYLEINPKAYQDKIHYFEKFKTDIYNLPFYLCVEMQCDYIEALHQTEKYQSVIGKIDKLIETVIIDNVHQINGEDIFKSLLFIKADALYKNIEYAKSHQVITALIKIDGDKNESRNLYLNNRIDELRYNGQKIRAICILLFLISAFIIAMEILMIRSLFPEWVNIFTVSRNGLFCLGLCTYFGYELYIRHKSKIEYLRLIK